MSSSEIASPGPHVASTDIDAFAVSAREWLASVVPARASASPSPSAHPAPWGVGDDSVAVFPEWESNDVAALLERARAYLSARHEAGFGGLTLSRDVGGQGLTHEYDACFEAQEGAFETPPSEVWNIGHHMVLPAIDRFGTDDQRRRLIPSGLRGELFFCQLFSEPDAGSDLASVRTRAIRRGDSSWVVSGQKVWTSVAHVADYGMLLCRTDPDATRHSGITCFLVPMHADGVRVRPIRQITGGSAFNEVWLDEVVIDDAWRLGEVHGGWSIARSTLGTERISVPLGGPHAMPSRLVDLARHHGLSDDPLVRQQLADLVVRRRIADLTMARVHSRMADGGDPGPFASILKLQSTQLLTAMGAVASSILGPRLVAETGEWGTWVWSRHILESAGLRIGGGTDEIQRNILAEGFLGLPRESRTERAA